MMATGMTSSHPTITKTILNSDDKKNSTDDKLSLGQFIHINQHYGFITFISEQYLTLCIHEYTKPEQLAEGARCKYNQCNVLIFREQWNDIRRTTDIHQRYIERTDLHPVE